MTGFYFPNPETSKLVKVDDFRTPKKDGKDRRTLYGNAKTIRGYKVSLELADDELLHLLEFG